MKFKKIKEIKNYKSFSHYSWDRFHKGGTFSNVNIIFGENGSGKSSIVDLLRSISGENQLGNSGPESAKLLLENGTTIGYTRNDGEWDREVEEGNIQIFDQEFVKNNIHIEGEGGKLNHLDPEVESEKLLILFDERAIKLDKEYQSILSDYRLLIKDKSALKRNNCSALESVELNDQEKELYDKFEDSTIEKINESEQILMKEKLELQEEAESLELLKVINEYLNYCIMLFHPEFLNEINYFLEKFGSKLELEQKEVQLPEDILILTKTKREGQAELSRLLFKVIVNGVERDFEEGLSEGERYTLSLCFFFASLERQQKNPEKILIFDDPAISHTYSNLSTLADLIKDCCPFVSQVFVLTHNRAFLKHLKRKLYSKNRENKKYNEYTLMKTATTGSFLYKTDAKLKEICKILEDFCNGKNISNDPDIGILIYGQLLRNGIEIYVKGTLSNHDEDEFSRLVDKIKDRPSVSIEDLETLKDIYSFCSGIASHPDLTWSHGVQELKQQIDAFLGIVERSKK